MEKDNIKSFDEIFEANKTSQEKENLKESQQLMEMATLRKTTSKLPVNIYLDDSMSYRRGKYARRIKFQKDKGDKLLTSSFASMKLDGTLVESTNKNSQLSSSEENELSQFVINNREAIKALSDMLIEIEDFKKIMIPGGETATDVQRMNMLNNLQIAIKEQGI